MFSDDVDEKRNMATWYITVTSIVVTIIAGIMQVFLKGTARNILLLVLFVSASVVLVSIIMLKGRIGRIPRAVTGFYTYKGALYCAENMRYVAIPHEDFINILDILLNDKCINEKGLFKIGKDSGKILGRYFENFLPPQKKKRFATMGHEEKIIFWAEYDSTNGLGSFELRNIHRNPDGNIELGTIRIENPATKPTDKRGVFLTGYVEGMLSEIWNPRATIKPKGKSHTKELHLDFECAETPPDPTPPPPPDPPDPTPPPPPDPPPIGPRPIKHRLSVQEEEDKIKEELRDWRKEQAAARGVPIHYILSNKAIEEIATRHIVEKDQLLEVKGIAEKKYQLYGDPILRITRKYFPRNK